MKFTRMGQWHELSEDGAYTVAAARVDDHFRFQAWKLVPEKGKMAALLGTFDDVEEARQRCRDHKQGVAA